MNATILTTDPDDEFFFREGCHILEMLNRPADPDLSIARARVAPGVRTAPHRLKGTRERYVVLEGFGEVSVGSQPQQSVAAGDIVSIPPDTEQSVFNSGKGDLIFLAICTPRFRPENYLDNADITA